MSSADNIKTLISLCDDIDDLSGVKEAWEDRMAELAAKYLKPGTKEVGGEQELCVLDLIWDLPGDRVFEAGKKAHQRAIDYYLGRKFKHVWGTGTLVQIDAEIGDTYAIRVRLRCRNKSKGCKGTTKAYAKPGCHTGAFCYIFNAQGDFLADLRNQEWECPECWRKRVL